MKEGEPDEEGDRAWALSTRIVPLRKREDRQRAELVTDVVDAFARLRASTLRFIAMLGGGENELSRIEAGGACSFDELLALLGACAERARFCRLADLQRVLERARHAQRHRDVIFAQAPVAEEATLREAAAALVRLDTALIGLSIEHVLERHAAGVPDAAISPAPNRGCRGVSAFCLRHG
ncbi:hypothetical protein WKR88_02890 [Trinickia caryophylli]|uniref:Uncharacterized protein n=1 Tax=Trinickia caryophylli TaxID=28094 RepID=A0A1X7FUM5_TRICW|nr:hypothetical protein [Trinickia caryophylli]PMS11911.1 hypothetical protein C0Z17_11945 [Trinickia caryophylli]TRX14013.1 hypothetical protein FNF07_21960 [Trinickia caryophylli]WQE15610.1 hypothetical protein U0034_24170 [Trinickia caryophylli]SMF58518.1 hypothetical protein SAMN06295900_111106 [Trinickia caryophylli]GLU33627.1 hypothetical protein Busp01_34690 [Trinickia caryophylli]